MKFDILQGNVFDMLPTIPPGSIDACVTSPPYWQLRSYLPKSHALKPLELGAEKTPAEFVANMVKVFALVRNALADHGTLWVNIGETYIGDGNAGLIPQRLAIALQDSGWIVRSVIVWHKPAPMPASLSGWMWRRCRVKAADGSMRSKNGANHRPQLPVDGKGRNRTETVGGVAQWADCPGCKRCEPNGGLVLRRGSWRPTSAWEPILMLAKTSDYFADGEAVKQPPAAATVSRDQYTRIVEIPDRMDRPDRIDFEHEREPYAVKHDHETDASGGANLRDVWTIASEPLKEKHYAAYPTKLVENCLRAATSAKGYCPACGKPWCRVVESEVDNSGYPNGPGGHKRHHEEVLNRGQSSTLSTVARYASRTLDWLPSCQCPDAASLEPRPGRVLDPFAGSGRTLLTARRLGLDAVGCELNPEYAAMCRRILTDDMPLFADVGQQD